MKTDNKSDDRHGLPDGFQVSGEVAPVDVRGERGIAEGENMDRRHQQGQPLNGLCCNVLVVHSLCIKVHKYACHLIS